MHLPSVFIASLHDAPGFEEAAFVSTHETGGQIVSVRLNPSKIDSVPVGLDVESKIPWSSHGYYLSKRPSFTLDPLFHAGTYYVQEASSMFLEQAITQHCDVNKTLRVLDLCAAPGGKSTLIQSLISKDSLLVSNEIIKSRASILEENISKWGAANVVVTNNEPAHFKRLPQYFDVLVVDAPCSGSGLFRKDPEAVNEWSLQNVQLCSERQKKILTETWDSLKPGGILIYSTCSYSTAENEDMLDWVGDHFEAASLPIQVEEDWSIVQTSSPVHQNAGYRFYPDKLKGEGFFIAVFKKAEEGTATKLPRGKNKMPLLSATQVAVIAPYVKQAADYNFIQWKEEVLAVNAKHVEDISLLQSVLYIKKAGVNLGTIIRNILVPAHEWAISSIATEVLPKVDADRATALEYLRKKDIQLNTDAKGWALLCYEKLPLGLVKILPGRCNNYYPKTWRILNM